MESKEQRPAQPVKEQSALEQVVAAYIEEIGGSDFFEVVVEANDYDAHYGRGHMVGNPKDCKTHRERAEMYAVMADAEEAYKRVDKQCGRDQDRIEAFIWEEAAKLPPGADLAANDVFGKAVARWEAARR